MRAGSIKKGGKVRHVFEVDHNWGDRRYYFVCSGADFSPFGSIDFKSTAPPCKSCVAKYKRDRDRATRALAKLGVK